MNKNIIALLLLAAGAITSAAQQNNVLSVSDESMTPTIVMPESAETDIRRMQEEWYLKNYIVLDSDLDKKNGGSLSDEVIIERLSKLPTIIEMPYNSIVGNSIRYYVNRPELVERMLGMSLYYMPIFEEALNRHNLPRELRYLPIIESALVPTAKSRVGAGGLWQFMPSTGSGLGLEQNSLVDMRFDPYASSEAAARYLKELNTTFEGDWSLAIAAYNCGPGNVAKALRRAGDGKHDFWEIYPFLPKETRGYVPAFIAANYIMTYHKNHDISPALARRPLVVDSVHINRRVHFQQISDVLDIPMEEIRALNPQYRQDIIPGDIKPYPLVLPSLQVYAYVASEDSIVNHDASRYARRGVVQPSDGTVTGTDARGEYVEEEVIKWHTVRRGETLTSISRKYGTTVSAIRKLNNCGKKVSRGRKLKIKTVVRRYKPTPEPQPVVEIQADSLQGVIAATDSTVTDSAATDSVSRTVSNAFAATDAVPTQQEQVSTTAPQQERKAQTQQKTKKKQQAAQTKYKVRRGDSLSKIASRHGVTVRALKRANNLTSDNISVGQRLIIPN